MTSIPHRTIAANNLDAVRALADEILDQLQKKHPLIKWRYFLNHIRYDDESSPVDSVDFRAKIYFDRNDRYFQQRVTVEMLELSNVSINEMISYNTCNSFANYIMSDGKDSV